LRDILAATLGIITKMTERKQKIFLDEHVFKGLTNLNDGFDSEKIKYFSESEFKIVLERVEKLSIKIFGIEPWKNGEYFGVFTCEDYYKQPDNPEWYWKAFKRFVDMNEELQYSASYGIHDVHA
jgi:hypothetical protein